MYALALTPFDGIRGLELDIYTDAEDAAEFRGKSLLQFVDGGGGIESRREILLTEFHLDLQRIKIVDTVDNEKIPRSEFLHAEDNAFDL